MADKYVNKSGNDSNTGADHANAYLTIQKGLDEIGSGDTLYVGYGEYTENLSLPNFSITIEADQQTVIDGTLALNDGGGVFKNIIFAQILHTVEYYYSDTTFINCEFRGHGFFYVSAEASILYSRCIFKNTGAFYVYTYVPNSPFLFDKCIFVQSDTLAIRPQAVNEIFEFTDCYLNDNVEMYDMDKNLADVFRFEYCCIEIEYWRFQDGTWASYAEAQAASPAAFTSCFDLPPNFDSNYCPAPWSPLIDNGSMDYIGARPPANNYGVGDDLFNGATFSDVEYNGTLGVYQVVAGKTVGTITTSVIDYGESQHIRNIFADADEVYRSDVLDYDNTDIPNSLTFRYRCGGIMTLTSISICNSQIDGLFNLTFSPNVFFRNISICGAKYRVATIVDDVGNTISGASFELTDGSMGSYLFTSNENGIISCYNGGKYFTNPVTVTISAPGKITFGPHEFYIVNGLDLFVQLSSSYSGGGSQIINGSFIRGI